MGQDVRDIDMNEYSGVVRVGHEVSVQVSSEGELVKVSKGSLLLGPDDMLSSLNRLWCWL